MSRSAPAVPVIVVRPPSPPFQVPGKPVVVGSSRDILPTQVKIKRLLPIPELLN